MPFPKSKKKVGQEMFEVLELEKQLAQILVLIDEKKKSIQDYFDQEGIKSLVASKNSKDGQVCSVKAKKEERATINYDIELLRKKLDAEIFNEITIRTYTINDIDKMLKLVKDAGVKAKDFKELLNIDIKVSKQEINRLYDQKELKLSDIKGCYTAKISKSIKVVEESTGGGN